MSLDSLLTEGLRKPLRLETAAQRRKKQRPADEAIAASKRKDNAVASERKRAFAVGLPAAASYAKDWLIGEDKTPVAKGAARDSITDVLSSAKDLVMSAPGAVARAARFAVNHPGEALNTTADNAATFLPGVGAVKTFREMTDMAAEARANGRPEEADIYSAIAVPMSAGVFATDGSGALAAKGLSRSRLAARPAYTRTAEGPFTVVARKGVEKEIKRAPEAANARTMTELRAIAHDRARSPALHLSDKASMETRGVPYDVSAKEPGTSLGKQGAIARAYDEALTGSPAYKHAVFERWGETNPQLVEKAKAQNYDQFLEASYDTLGKDITRQFDRLPLTMRYHEGAGEYGSPNDMVRDVVGNGNLNVFSGGDPHEFLSRIDPATGLSQNEMFRAAHDYHGHVVPGSMFGPKGEEAAFAAHAQTLDPLSIPALLSETRGQNSWVNYGNRNVDVIDQMNRVKQQQRERSAAQDWLSKNPNDKDPRYGGDAQRILAEMPSAEDLRAQLHELGSKYEYAPQRGLLLPPEFADPYTTGGMPDWMREVMQVRAPTNDVRGVHFSKAEGLSELDPSYYGTGAFSGERQMVRREGLPDRTYLYNGPEGTVRPEESVGRVGQHVYETRLNNLYDVNADPESLTKLARAYNLPDYQPVSGENMTRISGVGGQSLMPDLERLIRDYGYDGFLSDMGRQRAAAVYKPVKGLRRITAGPDGYAEGGSVS